jgi:hypothetical protein
MVLVMSRSIAQGAAAGVAAAAGVSVGLVGHTLLATLGLGAILRTSEWLFVALKFAGAAYLVWLGLGLLRTQDATLALATQSRASLRRLFADGALSNLSNPKIRAVGRRPTGAGGVRAGAGVAALSHQGAGRLAGRLCLRGRPAVLRWSTMLRPFSST